MAKAINLRNSLERLQIVTLVMYKKTLILSVAGLSIITFYGDILFPLVFGSNWLKAGYYSQWLSLWLIFNFSKQPLITLYSILERQGEALLWNIVIFILRNGVIILSFYFLLGDITTIKLLSLIGAFIEFTWSVRLLNLTGVPLKIGIFTTIGYSLPILIVQGVIAVVLRQYLDIPLL